jgi:hypothetical protein
MWLIYGIWLGLLFGCQFSKDEAVPALTLANRVLWKNKVATSYVVDSTENRGNAIDATPHFDSVRKHHFEFLGDDTVHIVLHEFDQEYRAYAAFAENANRREMAEGFYQDGNRLFFYHGRYVGEWRDVGHNLISGHLFQNSLVFQGEELFLKPPEFQSFPLLGRIAKSERVNLQHFLGKNWIGPVFSIQYHCNDDTAALFRGFPQEPLTESELFSNWVGKFDTLFHGDEIRFLGQNEWHEPLLFWGFRTGMVGVVGCYDQEMAISYGEKMKKMTILWKSPRFLGKNERMN